MTAGKKIIALIACVLLLTTSFSAAFASDDISNIKVNGGNGEVRSIVIKGEDNIKKLTEMGIIRSNLYAGNKDEGVQSIVIKGKENIDALKGLHLRVYTETAEGEVSNLSDDKVTPYGTTKPTKTWDLNNGGRAFTYNFKSYIYSDYNYIPYDDGYAPSICVTIEESSAPHNLKMQLIESGTDKVVATFEEYIDDEQDWMIGKLSSNKTYYIKFISPDNVQIKGSGGVA